MACGCGGNKKTVTKSGRIITSSTKKHPSNGKS
jgi:hypothetical protein